MFRLVFQSCAVTFSAESIQFGAVQAQSGGAQATTDLLAGAIDAHMMSSAVGAGQAESPNLKMLAVASRHRLAFLPRQRYAVGATFFSAAGVQAKR